jgi:hypothetical protein
MIRFLIKCTIGYVLTTSIITGLALGYDEYRYPIDKHEKPNEQKKKYSNRCELVSLWNL